MGRRNEHTRAELQDMVLRAAEEILAEQGRAALTTRRIAERIGYTVGSLYLVFKSLDDIVLHVNTRTLDLIDQAVAAQLIDPAEPLAELQSMGRAYLRVCERHRARWQLLFTTPGARQHPEWFREKLEASFLHVETRLRALAPHRKQRAVRTAARALWSGVHGIALLALFGKMQTASAGSPQALSDELIRNFVLGFKRGD